MPRIEPTSTSVWSLVSQPAKALRETAIRNGRLCSDTGARESWTESEGAKTCTFDAAATEIASGAVPGEPTVPSPNSSRELPAAMTGTTPASTTLCTASISTSFAGSVSAPPPEKLITSMPSATAASKAVTISGELATNPSGLGMLKTR